MSAVIFIDPVCKETDAHLKGWKMPEASTNLNIYRVGKTTALLRTTEAVRYGSLLTNFINNPSPPQHTTTGMSKQIGN